MNVKPGWTTAVKPDEWPLK